MKRFLILVVVLIASALNAQNFTTITASNIQDATGAKLASGVLCAIGTDNNDTPLPYYKSATGVVVRKPVCTTITAGVISGYQLANTNTTNPLHVCYRLTIRDSSLSSSAPPLSTLKCVQPTGATYSLDSDFSPNLIPQVVVQTGPKGDKGDKGDPGVSGVGADPNCSTDNNGKLTCAAITVGKLQMVKCGGTNDSAALQAALNNGGHIMVDGGCVVPSGGGLTVISDTWLDLGSSSITMNLAATSDILLQNTQNAQTVQRQFTDGVTTAGSKTVTSATASFTSADKDSSIECVGAYGSGTLAWAADVAIATSLHTTIQSVTNGTTIVLRDAASVSVNPATCKIRRRDTNIRVTGGTLILNNAAACPSTGNQSGPWIASWMTVNNLHIEGVTFKSIGTGGCKLQHIEDATYELSRSSFYTASTYGDGTDVTGPATGMIRDIYGWTYDDLISLTPSGGDHTYWPTQGAIAATIDNVDGSSNYSLLKLAGVTGNAMPFEVTARRIHARESSYPTVNILKGKIDKIDLDTVGGKTVANAIVSADGLTSASFILRNPYQNYAAYNTSGSVLSIAGATLTNLLVENYKSDGFIQPTFIIDDATTTVQNGTFKGFDVANIAGGEVIPFKLLGTWVNTNIENSNLGYATSTDPLTRTGVVSLQGRTKSNLKIDGLHLTFAAGSKASGPLVNVSSDSGGNNTTLTNLQVSNVVVDSASPISLYLVNPNAATSSPTNFIGSNIRINNISGCAYTGFPGTSSLDGLIATNITDAGSCYSLNDKPFILPIALSATNQGATINATTAYTATKAGEMVKAECQVWTGSTTGTATVQLQFNNSGTANFGWQTSPTVTLSSSTSGTYFSPIMYLAAIGNYVQYRTVYTANSGGTYSFSCKLVKLQ